MTINLTGAARRIPLTALILAACVSGTARSGGRPLETARSRPRRRLCSRVSVAVRRAPNPGVYDVIERSCTTAWICSEGQESRILHSQRADAVLWLVINKRLAA